MTRPRLLWPPPARGELVVLSCGCHARIVFGLPLVFLYFVRFVRHDAGCARRLHATSRRMFVTLEAIQSRADSPPPV